MLIILLEASNNSNNMCDKCTSEQFKIIMLNKCVLKIHFLKHHDLDLLV